MEKASSRRSEPYVDPASLPLKLPPGFAISVFAKNLPGARVLALDPNDTLLVSLTSQGKVVALPDKDEAGVADAAVTVLDRPQPASRPGLRP